MTIDLEVLKADPDFPPDVVITALANGRYNFKRAKSDEADQWQIAIEGDTDTATALIEIVRQHDRAQGRVWRDQWRAERQAREQAAQEAFAQRMRGLALAQDLDMAATRAAIRARHGKPDTPPGQAAADA